MLFIKKSPKLPGFNIPKQVHFPSVSCRRRLRSVLAGDFFATRFARCETLRWPVSKLVTARRVGRRVSRYSMGFLRKLHVSLEDVWKYDNH
jgi:hypothetical protein